MNNKIIIVIITIVIVFATIGVWVGYSGSEQKTNQVASNSISIQRPLNTAEVNSSIPLDRSATDSAINSPTVTEYLFVEDAHNNQVVVLNTDGGFVKRVDVGAGPHDIAASPDGTKVVTANYFDGSISVIDTEALTLDKTVKTDLGAHGVVFSTDSNYLFVANEKAGTVSVLETNDFSEQKIIDIDAYPEYIKVSTDGSRIVTTNLSGQGVLTILENNGLQSSVYESINLSIDNHGIAFSPSGIIAVVTNFSSATTYILDGNTLEPLRQISTGSYSEFATFFSDRELWITHIGSHDISIIDVDENVVKDTITVGETPHGITFSKDKTRAYVPLFDSGEIVIINVSDREVIGTVSVGSELHNSVMVQID